MSSYHGWTHRKKSDGGTDPIYPEDEWPTGEAGSYEVPLGERHNNATQEIATGTGWTSVTLQEGQVSTTVDDDVTLTTDGLILGSGVWIVTARVFWDPAFTTGYSQILANSTGSGSVALLSERSSNSEINRLVIVWPRPNYPSTVKLWVRQTSGSNQVINSALISAARMFGDNESFGVLS